MKNLLLRLALGASISLGASVAFADTDPTGRVGRLSYTEGTVSFHTADQDHWSPAVLNYPVVAGESFWTEPQSRAEIQVGSAEFRLDETAALDVVALDEHDTRLQLQQGVINVHLRTAPPSPVQVMTAYGEVDLIEAGTYHIDAGHPTGDAPAPRIELTALEGRAEMIGPRSRLQIFAGESAFVGGNPISVTLGEANSTPFDDWALQRERREAALAATRYVSPEATGYQDLDAYGRWGSDPTYGAVWYPTAVAVDWAPYRYGHWAWVPPWGWTWIDDAPWGFAPFHYGRWVVIDGRWGWCPGTVLARPVYAPALVAFIGGPGFGVTIAGSATMPAVGWVPLAPFEVYRPYYRTSVTYVRNVNVTNVSRTVINHITTVTYVNQTVAVKNYHNHEAATVVPQQAFVHAAPVHQATLVVPHERLAQAHAANNVEHLKPTPAARAGIAVPAATEMVRPNTPPRRPMHEEAPAMHAEPKVPAAPGPAFAHPGGSAPPMAAHAPPAPAPQGPRHDDATARPGAPERAMRLPAPDAQARPATAPTIQAPAAGRVPPVAATPAAPQPPRLQPPAAARDEGRAPPANRPAVATPPKPAAAAQRPPLMQVQRPVQQTRLAPTPQGWARAAGPPPSRAAHPPAAAHPAPKEHQPGEGHKPGG